jgi:hypothetical protein
VDQSSDAAVYRRFLNPHGRLTAAELRYLTEVDHHDHEAPLHRLADRARDEGITRFTALMLSGNRPMRRLLADLGTTRLLSSGAGAVELAVDLHPNPPATAAPSPARQDG